MTKYMAVFTGKPGTAMPDQETIARGMAGWSKWMNEHGKSLVDMGGPLGKTLKVSKNGIENASNMLSGYVIVEAPSHEDAARMFENHPQFAIFPGEGVEVMQVMPIPGS